LAEIFDSHQLRWLIRERQIAEFKNRGKRPTKKRKQRKKVKIVKLKKAKIKYIKFKRKIKTAIWRTCQMWNYHRKESFFLSFVNIVNF
jgi:hypothetical protein